MLRAMPLAPWSSTARSRALTLCLSPLLAALLTATAAAPATAAPRPPVSSAAAAEEDVDLTATTAPEITGSPVVGQTLTVIPPQWSEPDVTTTYQWLRDGQEVTTGASPTYLLGGEDVDRSIMVVATGSRADGTGVALAASEPFGPVAKIASALAVTATSPRLGAVTVTVQVTAADEVVAGTVSVDEFGSELTSATVVDGHAVLQLTGAEPGAHSYQVTYEGTDRIAAVTETVDVQVQDLLDSAVTVTGTSSAIGRLALTATVRSGVGLVSGGTVSVLEGERTLAPAIPVSGGRASWSATGQPGGRHTYTLRYSGTGTVKPSETDVTVDVLDRAASVVTASGTSSAVGKLALTATVRSGGKAVTGGTVAVLEGGRTLAPKLPVNGGKASWSATGQPSGRHTYTVRYSGTGTTKPSEATVTVTVRARVKPSVGVKASSPAPRKVRLVVTVRASGQSSLAGTVKITEGGRTLKAAVAVVRGTATWSASKVGAGRHTYTATYSGTSQVTTGSASGAVDVVVIKTYKNCTAMHRVWPHGVGRSGAEDRVTSGTPVTNFLRSTKLYGKNTKSDRDKDGVACEAH